MRDGLGLALDEVLEDAQQMTWFDGYALQSLRDLIEAMPPPVRIAGE